MSNWSENRNRFSCTHNGLKLAEMTTGTTETTGTTNYSPTCFMRLEPSAFLIKAFTQILSHRARKKTRSVLKSTVRVAIKNTALL